MGGAFELPTRDELLAEKNLIEIEKIKQNSVVLIGSYSDPVLKIIRECLEETGEDLAPVEARYVKERRGMTPRQKLHAILSVCDFVIAEDSVPCGEMIELEYCRHTGAITAVMHRGQRSSFMTLDCDLHSPDFKKFPYKSTGKAEMKKVIRSITRWVKTSKNCREKEIRKFDMVKLAYSNYCSDERCQQRKRF